MRLLACAVFLTALASPVLAGGGDDQGENEDGDHPSVPRAPEIDPGLVGGSLAVLIGGTAILAGRRRRS